MSTIMHTVWHFIHRWRLLTSQTLFGYVTLSPYYKVLGTL